MLRVLPHTFEPVLQQIRWQGFFNTYFIKRSIVGSQDSIQFVFSQCCPFYGTLRVGKATYIIKNWIIL